MDEDAAALRTPSSSKNTKQFFIVFSLRTGIMHTLFKKLPCPQNGLIRHKYTYVGTYYLVVSSYETKNYSVRVCGVCIGVQI